MVVCYIDVTDIRRYVETETTISGIQRVVLGVAKRLIGARGSDQVKLCYWHEQTSKYYAVDGAFLLESAGFDARSLRLVLWGPSVSDSEDDRSKHPLLRRYHKKPSKYAFHKQVANLHALVGNDAYFEKHKSSIEVWNSSEPWRAQAKKEWMRDTELPSHTLMESVIRKEDQILILDAGWGNAHFDKHLVNLVKTVGVEVTLLVHDLIPLKVPESVVGGFTKEFYRWLKTSTEYCTSYIANSNSTARDLNDFLKEHQVDTPVNTIPLAQEFEGAQSVPSTLEEQIKVIEDLRYEVVNVNKMPFVLVVGTIETRKNLWRLLQAWQRLSQLTDIEVPRLVLAGKFGWNVEEIRDWMQATGNLGGWVKFVEYPSDKELAYLLQNCLFTAKVSRYEGWGLPIGESLSCGKTAVVADNSSMPEVGQDMVEYCDASSITSIYNACHKLISDPEHRKALEKRIAETTLRTWDDVATDYIKLLER